MNKISNQENDEEKNENEKEKENENVNVNLNNKTIPLILDGKFFKIIRIDESGENIQGECITCKHKIKGRIDATTNFLSHLKVYKHYLVSFLIISLIFYIGYLNL